MQNETYRSSVILESALLNAIRQIAELDESMPVGNVAVVPDVILWMMEKTTPDLMRNVVDLGLWDRLLPLIDDYALLRSRTQPCCVGSASDIIPESLDYSPPSTRISFDDLLEALSRETVHVGSG